MYKDKLGNADSLLKKAIQLVVEYQQASASLLQRRLKIGYARSSRLIDQLEQLGVISPSDGDKPRNVLFKKEELNWNSLEKLMKDVINRQRIYQIKQISRRILRIFIIALILYLLKLFFGFEWVLIIGFAIIIENLTSSKVI